MPARPFRSFTAWLLFTAGLALVLLTSWPLPSQSIQWTATADSIAYTFTLDWPSLVRVGENHTAVLVVKQTAASPAPSVSSSMLESRLEFNHLLIDPAGVISQPVGSAGVNEFRWSVTTWQAGKLPGTLWIYAASRMTRAPPRPWQPAPSNFAPLVPAGRSSLAFAGWAQA